MRTIECINSITRMKDEYQEMLVERIKEDFLGALRKGHIDADLYSPVWKTKIFDLISSPKSYIEKERARRERIENVIRNYEMIILYGAGKIACRVLQLLREGRLNTKVKFIAVSEIEGNPEMVEGIPVKAIEELRQYKERALVIISVGNKYVQEVEKNLCLQGFQYYKKINDLVEG